MDWDLFTQLKAVGKSHRSEVECRGSPEKEEHQTYFIAILMHELILDSHFSCIIQPLNL